MSNGDERGFAAALLDNAGFQTETAQIRARATLLELLPEPPAYAWTYIAPRVVRNATAALFELEEVAIRNGDAFPEYAPASLQYAHLWESLANLREGVDREGALLNAAAAYELAGYQANAASIARSLSLDDGDSPLHGLVAAFLQRYLLRVRARAAQLSAPPRGDVSSVEAFAAQAATAVFARALDSATLFFLAGDHERLDQAVVLLEKAEEAFARLGGALEANLARLLRAVVPAAARRSTWTVLGGTVRGSPRWDRYLKVLARGVGRNLMSSASVSELWRSQTQALEQGLLDPQRSAVVRMPTSAGKTRVAELAIVEALIANPGSMCVYVAPFRALVSEVEETLATILADLGYRVSSIVGAYESNDFERLIADDADVLVVTPEKFDLLLRLRAEGLARIQLIVLDEGHLVDDLERGAKFELLLSRLKIQIPNARLLALSAVVPDRTLEDFSLWLTGASGNTIESTWRPSLQRVARLQWGGSVGVLRYEPSPDTPLLSEFVPGLIRRRQFEFVNPLTGRINRPWFPETGNKGHVAAALAWEYAKLGPTLIFTTQRSWVQSLGQSVLLRLQLAEWTGENLPPYFRTPRTRSVQTAEEWLGDTHVVTQLLRAGIAVHHGQLPQAVRDAIERDFRDRHYRVIVATTTLAQGVNLPVRAVIVHSSRRHNETTQRMERIEARDYWNIAGRAGRARAETEGTIVHIVSTPADADDYAYFLRRRNDVEPVESALHQALRALVDGRMTQAGVAAALDPEILAMIVEEASEDDLAHIDRVLSESLVAVQATVRGQTLGPLRNALYAGRTAILERVPARDLLPLYSTTGLSSTSCETLRNRILAQEEELRRLLDVEPPNYRVLAERALGALLQIDEMEPAEGFAGMVGDLLFAWLAGETIDDIRARFEDDAASVEELTRFLEDFFGYQLPLGALRFSPDRGACPADRRASSIGCSNAINGQVRRA